MSFAALEYVWSTITVWHLVIWIAITALVTIVIPMIQGTAIGWSGPASILWLLAMWYGLFSIMFGQIFGEKFGFLDVIPSGFLFGLGFAALAVVHPSQRAEGGLRANKGCAILAVLLGASFFGVCTWLLPRVIGFGIIDFPKYAWAVQT